MHDMNFPPASEAPDGAPLTAAPRLWVDGPLRIGEHYSLPPATAQHVGRALRMREGDAVTLIDGRGGEYAARLQSMRRDGVTAEVLAHRAVEREAVLPIRLVQCLQGGDKMDFTIQKAVELGVREIVPVISRRSIVRLDGARAQKRVEHWRQIVQSASEQCGRNRLAAVAEIQPFERWLAKPAADESLRLLLSPYAAATVATVAVRQPAGIELLIGPEGGLASDEIAVALGRNFCELCLGPRVLRTETAGLAAIAALHARWGDFI